jgi:hypothetical protein
VSRKIVLWFTVISLVALLLGCSREAETKIESGQPSPAPTSTPNRSIEPEPAFTPTRSSNQSLQYDYQLGLAYGFLGRAVKVWVDEREVLSVVGTDEIEQYAQLLGTMMLVSSSSPVKEIAVRVTVDGNQSYEQTIDLSTGPYIHIYQEQTGLHIYNTKFLVEE